MTDRKGAGATVRAAPDEAKERARRMWAAGTYHEIARITCAAAAELVHVAGVRSGQRVLDVGCGSGNTAITARRAGAAVTGLDLTPELLEMARAEATVGGFEDIRWDAGDAEAMTYPDASFDVVLSSFGHMFAPRPAVVTAEMLRVLRPGGTLAFATWPPESTPGRHLAATAAVLPPAAGAEPPSRWGLPEVVRERLGGAVDHLHFERGHLWVPSLGPAHLFAFFRERFGPTRTAWEALAKDPAQQGAFRAAWMAGVEPMFRGNACRFDYLLTRARKR